MKWRSQAVRRSGFPPDAMQCYTVSMIDPLTPIAGVSARLVLAGILVACLWLTVAWAL